MAICSLVAATFHGASGLEASINQPALHFDATVSSTMTLDPEGAVTLWRSLAGNGELVGGFSGHKAPVLVQPAMNGMPALRFDGTQKLLALDGNDLPEVRFGSVHMFVVARIFPGTEDGFLLGMGEEDNQFLLFSDGRNYRLRTGDAASQRRAGPQVDSGVRLLEIHHTITDDLQRQTTRRFWPGEFIVDGALCGKFFNDNSRLPIEALTVGANSSRAGGWLRGEIGEILMFNQPLGSDRIVQIRRGLAAKWGIDLTEKEPPADLPSWSEVRVGPAEADSSFGYFGESPESPDGSRIAYVVFQNQITPDEPVAPVDLWICDRDLRNHRLVLESAIVTGLHNGAVTHWVDDHRIVFGSDRRGEVKVVNVDTGEVEFGPFSPGWPGGIGHRGQVLLHMSGESELGPVGLYQLDTQSGRVTRIFSAHDFKDYHAKHNWRGGTNPDRWRFVHGKFSEEGSHIGFAVVTDRGSQHLFTARTDGSDLRLWGRLDLDTGSDKPLHWQWYDDEMIYGVDQDTYDGTPNNLYIKKWNRDGDYVRTLAGVGNHLAMSPDKQWFAGENFYFDNPVRLFLYRSGQTKPTAVIFEDEGMIPTWINSGHVNPSFSRDGKRLYYNRPVNNEFTQAYYVDISNIRRGEYAAEIDPDPRESTLPYQRGELLFADSFQEGLGNWLPELQAGGRVEALDGKLVVDVPSGCTIWLRNKLEGPLVISYEATVIGKGGPNDRVSDLNCFWMAQDARSPEDIFGHERSGIFSDYNELGCYYVGLGGHGNTRTRFRRYIGHAENRPLLPEHDLHEERFMIVPNKTKRIQLIAFGNLIQYYRDDELIFSVTDEAPYTKGWFAFRTVRNHMEIRNFEIHRLDPAD